MGRRRKGNRKSKTESSEVRPKTVQEILSHQFNVTELENKMRRLRDSLAGDILRIYSSEEQIPTEKQKPPRLPTEDLERILGALHDGIRPGPGLEDLELLADIVCELIERRKAETDRSGWKTLKGAATY